MEKLKQFIKDTYGIQVVLQPLSGYEDINYLAEIDGNPAFIVKLTKDPRRLGMIQAQEEIVDILNRSTSFIFPAVVRGKDNRTTYQFDNTNILRILKFVEGEFLAESDHSADLLHQFGNFLGIMDYQLKDYRNAFIQSRHYEWDLQLFDEYFSYLKYIDLPERKKLVDYFLIQFNKIVKPVLSDIRKSIIHNDANDWNVLVEGQSIKGIIDFGDVVYAPTVNELAVACTYMAMDSPDPIAKILPIVQGYHQEVHLTEKEIRILYYLIAARLCVSVCQSAFSKTKDPDNQYISIHEDKAWSLLDHWLTISPDRAENSFRAVCNIPKRDLPGHHYFKESRDQYISHALSISYHQPVFMQKAAFQYMYGDSGKTYLDCVNNIMHVGHCHPEVVRAGQHQLATLNTNTRYYYHALNEYAEKIINLFPSKLDKVFFVNSGSAASDLALRLARNFTGNKDMIVLEQGYHGNTTAAIEVSHYKFAGKGGQGKEPFIHIMPLPDTYRGLYTRDDPDAGVKYADHIDSHLEQPVAGFICEPIVGCGGQIVLPDQFLPTVYRKVRETGGVCIADEVQTGFGRVGTHFWAYEMYDVVPDIVILGKPIGNGHPLGAVVCTTEIATSFENGMEFFSSFGGNPVSCEIGKAVLRVIREENLQSHALSVGRYLLDSFSHLKKEYPVIGDIRGSGLFLGVELVREPEIGTPATEEADKLINFMKEQGILLSTDGPENNVIKIKPPLCFSMDNGKDLIHNFERGIEKVMN